MTKITSAIAAALVASASFASVALADEGKYYDGAQKPVAGASVDTFSTGSISNVRADGQNGKLLFNNGGSRDNRGSDLNNGDYYNGANRPS